ncbi:Catenin alpha, partial [Operophtera brumata]
MSKFAVRVDAAVSALGGNAGGALDENDFIDASRLVYDAVREIRRAVLMNRDEEELDPEDVDLDDHYTLETRSKCNRLPHEAMRKMTEEDKRKILQQVELFRREKMTFDVEVAKWDDAGNDIIMLAKHMCMIMLEMTDFTSLPAAHRAVLPPDPDHEQAPEKKPLIRPEKPEEVRAKVRRGSQKLQPSPVRALAEFQSPAPHV